MGTGPWEPTGPWQGEPRSLMLAPMAGVTDLPFRLLARECGASLAITEFTNSTALTREATTSWRRMETHAMEDPFIPQIFGGDLNDMVTAAGLLEPQAQIIDLNFGCPAPKVCRNDAGAALLRDPDKVVRMVRACIKASDVPITVKMRLGTGSGPNTALEICQRLEAEGVERICVHGRTLRQRYSGESDWSQIRDIVQAVDIPVIANGDVVDAKTAAACLEQTGAAGLMIGRGAIGRPTLFHEIKRDLGWSDGRPPWGEDDPAIARHWCWERYIELSSELYREHDNKNLKRHAVSFTKGLPGASAMRVELHSIHDQRKLGQRVSEYLNDLDLSTQAVA